MEWFKKFFKKYSKEPWIEVRGGSVDPERGVRLELDWNSAFIEHLKANGIVGRSEEESVHLYLSKITKMMDKKFEDMGGNSEYL